MYVSFCVPQPGNYPNVPTKRREHTPDRGQPAENHCVRKLMELQKQVGLLILEWKLFDLIVLNRSLQRIRHT